MDNAPERAPDRPAEAPPDGARLPLTITVGFTGHRALGEHSGEVAAALGAAFAVVRDSLAGLEATLLHPDERLGDAYGGPARLRLVSGEAPGSDRLAIASWNAGQLGEVHPIYPFRDHATGGALTDHPDFATADAHVAPAAAAAAWTGLDATDLGLTRNQAHRQVGEWIVRHADLLIAVWDGAAIERQGGTGDTLRAALERGVPAIWVQPGEKRIRLIDPQKLRRQGETPWSAAKVGAADDLGAGALTPLLLSALAPPGGARGARDPEVIARRDYVVVDPLRRRGWPLGPLQSLMDRTLWRSYRAFETIVGGRLDGREMAWDVTAPVSLKRQQGFAYLESTYDQAEARAARLSAIHRSEQLLLILIAMIAVFVGVAPALLDGAPGTHAAAAAAEFALGGVAFVVALYARQAHRHRRWSDARRLAERLRAARATWPLGVDIADAQVTPPRTWTEWRALAILRAAGPRRGWVTREAIRETVGWFEANLIDGQIDYHAKQAAVAARIERRIRWTENAAFGFLMTVLACFLAADVARRLGVWSPPHWVGGALIVVSAGAPAIGAACLALNATIGFSELALRSERMQREFEQMKRQLGAAPDFALRHIQDVARHSAQLLVEDADAWRDRLAGRRIVRGG